MEPLLLMIDGHDAQVLQDALTAFANERDRMGDPTNESTHADELWEKLDALKELDREEVRQLMKAVGLGRYKGRPQG